jgi:putative tryptophan/tyrosine transport system substrate-binding protein
MIARRTFLAGTGAVLLAAPLAAEAQHSAPSQPRQVGWLAMVAEPPLQDEFRRGMRELGHVEGSTYSVHGRYAESRADALPGLAAELARLKLDVIVAETGAAARAAGGATTETPIVFITSDPLGTGLVQSLARPGGNLTGISNIQTELYPKRMDVLKAAIPTVRRVATIEHATFGRRTLLSQMVQEAARALGIEALPTTFVGRVEELDRAVAQAVHQRADAVLFGAHPFFNVHMERILALAARHRLPAIYEFRSFVEAGGLMCYGTDMKVVFHRVATYVDKILKGAKPGDLPVEQPTKFELVINLKTAKALGLTIPPSLLGRADEIIQ